MQAPESFGYPFQFFIKCANYLIKAKWGGNYVIVALIQSVVLIAVLELLT
jgi:hypothetical protein